MIIRPYRFASAAGGGDPYWANVASLLHFDGADGSQDFTDQKGLVWTPSLSTIKLASASAKFGSCGLKGSSGGALTAPLAGPTASGDFTCELWMRSADVYSGAIALCCGQSSSSTAGAVRLGFYRNAVDLIMLNSSGSLINLSDRAVFGAAVNTWYYVAACITGGSQIKVFVNGTLYKTLSISGGPFISGTTRIGTLSTASNEAFLGDIDDVRITPGIARYSANFTPPTAPFPNHA